MSVRRYRDMSFANKVRFWVITFAIIVGLILALAITYSIYRGDGINASGEAFGARGGLIIGQAKQ